MEDFLTYKHSFNAGDLITTLPGIKKMFNLDNKKAIIYQRLNIAADYGHSDEHPVVDRGGRKVCMNEKVFLAMKPLLEAQEYIERFEVWNGQEIDIDFDVTRTGTNWPLPNGPIHHWVFITYHQLECDLSQPWINVEGEEKTDFICINRTARYQNQYMNYFFLKKYEEKILFLGTQNEYEIFSNMWGLNIKWHYTNNFLELAKIIKGCRFFVGNQSLCWHIADAMKTKRLLEVCAHYPNTFPTGKNGYSFIKQEALENRFERLLKETE